VSTTLSSVSPPPISLFLNVCVAFFFYLSLYASVSLYFLLSPTISISATFLFIRSCLSLSLI
jgi:hypothetical protein